MITIIPLLLLLFTLQNVDCQSKYQTIPRHFDVAIRQLREYYYNYDLQKHTFLNFGKLLNKALEPDQFFANVLLTSNKSNECEQDMKVLIEAASREQLWALKVLDSWGKPLPSGLLKGNLLWTGNYDECIKPLYQANNKSFLKQPFDTQYCTLLTDPSKAGGYIASSVVIGLCLPSSCNRQTMVSFINGMFNDSNITEAYLHCANELSNKKNDRLGGVIAICVVISILALVVFIGTLIDLIIPTDPTHQSLFEKIPQLVVIAEFSAIRTLKHVFTMRKKENDNSFAFINGIRVLALFWIIFCHSFIFGIYYTANNLDVLSWSHNMAFQLILSGILSVDTFFVLSGFLTAIVFVRQVAKEKFSRRLMVLYYIHRYIRLTPTFILVMFVSIYLTPYFGHGPVYPTQQGFESEECRNHYWWTAFLYIGNLIKPESICLSVSWYLYVDMQFHWIAPLALIPFVMGRKIVGYIVATVFVFISIGSIFGILLYYPNLYPNMVRNALELSTNKTGPTYQNAIYATPWCRISSYAIGLLVGFIIIHKGRTYHLNVKTKLIGSIVAIVLGLVCIFSLYGDYIMVPGLNRASIIAYETLSRSAWSVVIGWLLFLCSTNQGGIVNTILSWPIWVPLARLNYSAYLIHLTVIYVTIYNQTVPFYYQPLTVINNYVSQLFFSYLAATLVFIFFEAPFFVIEKKLFKR